MRLAVGITLLLAVLTSARVDGAAADPRPANPSHAFPLWFESHHGAYVSRGAGYALSVSPGAAVLALRGGTVRMRMLGGSVSPHMEPLDPLPGHATWCAGGDACETFATYGQVLNRSVYPGIDVVFYGNQGRLEYDFRVAAGSSARRIALAFEGARRMQIDNRGDLLLNTGAAEIRQSKPIAYQLVEGRPREVAVAYRLDRAGHVRFRLGQHDSRRELVIDPALIFDNQVGASAGSAATALALDAQGNVYVAGQNYPLNSRITGPPGDLFIDKWNAAGNQLIYSTNLGGSGLDVVSGLAVDAGGSAYLYGTTTSTDFPVTANAFQKSLVGIRNAFVVKASPDGTRLVYSSLLGGGAEQTGGIAVDSSGAAYVIGTTFNNFPTTPAAVEINLGGDLDDALAVGADGVQRAEAEAVGGAGQVDNLTGGVELDGAVHSAPLGVVKDVVGFEAQLDVAGLFLAELNLLVERHVPVLEAGAAKTVDAGIGVSGGPPAAS